MSEIPFALHSIASANYETLENLPGRGDLLKLLDQHFNHPGQRQQLTGLLLFDIQDFRRFNSHYGHASGDQLLLDLANRLHANLRDSDQLFRIGSDEFAVLLDELRMPQQVQLAAQKLETVLDEPFTRNNRQIRVRLTQGGALSPIHADNAPELFRCAESAMLEAKTQHRNFCLYNPQNVIHQEDLTLESELEQALHDGELELFFQPKISLATGHVVSAEALTRWIHPERGPISPGLFIPVAERSELIVAFTEWAVNAALHQLQTLQQRGIDISLAVNLSPRALSHPDIAELIQRAMRIWHPPPHSLILEITEGAVMEHPEHSLQILGLLDQSGVQVSIDDFGTGHSSLSYLKQLPAKELKIDQSFIRNLPQSVQDQQIVKSVIELGHNFGLKVVAEGIEDAMVMNILKTLGCDLGQGYHFSRALNADEFFTWLETSDYRPR